MGIETWIAIGVILLIIGLALWYVIRAKKKGQKCIGCPACGNCSQCSGCQTPEK